MILAQFRSLYPTGALITELLQISHGQYIVRATVKIEDVIRSTGMASALNIEEAEDKSRERALMVLGITNTSSLIEDTSLKDNLKKWSLVRFGRVSRRTFSKYCALKRYPNDHWRYHRIKTLIFRMDFHA